MAKKPYRRLFLCSASLAFHPQGAIRSTAKLPIPDSSVSSLALKGHSLGTGSGLASELHHTLTWVLSPSVTLLCFTFLFVNSGWLLWTFRRKQKIPILRKCCYLHSACHIWCDVDMVLPGENLNPLHSSVTGFYSSKYMNLVTCYQLWLLKKNLCTTSELKIRTD